jgi:voltage-gated potassium channel
MFNIDDTFDNFFDAIYWSTTTLTTVGYGDIVPQNTFGRVLTMLSSIVGIAIIALPSGIITASYLKALEDIKVGDIKEHRNP